MQPCAQHGCPELVHSGHCEKHQSLSNRDYKTREERKFYSSNRWRLASLRHRREEPLCRMCKEEGRAVIGNVTDHIVPLRAGGQRWDDANLQTVCDYHHQQKRQRERQG